MADLASIFQRHGTDKYQHGYAPYYELHLRPDLIGCLLEVGVASGVSLLAWRDWTSHAEIHGLDIGTFPDALVDQDRVHFHRGNVLDHDVVQHLPDAFDVVVDDGSHATWDIQGAVQLLWPRVVTGGWYIVEDLHAPGLDVVGGTLHIAQPSSAHLYDRNILFMQKA